MIRISFHFSIRVYTGTKTTMVYIRGIDDQRIDQANHRLLSLIEKVAVPTSGVKLALFLVSIRILYGQIHCPSVFSPKSLRIQKYCLP